MENDVLITEENMMDSFEQEKTSLDDILACSEINMDTIPEELPQKKKLEYKICKCGSILYKNHKSEFRCGQCGNILYTTRSD